MSAKPTAEEAVARLKDVQTIMQANGYDVWAKDVRKAADLITTLSAELARAKADSARLDFLEAKDHWEWGLSCWNVDDETNNGWTYGRIFEEPTYTGKTARDAIDAAQAAAKST